MSFLDFIKNAVLGSQDYAQKRTEPLQPTQELSAAEPMVTAKTLAAAEKNPQTRALLEALVDRQLSTLRTDIKNWKSAVNMALQLETPLRYQLEDVFTSVLDDATLTSQIEKRTRKVLKSRIAIYRNGKKDDALTEEFRKKAFVPDAIKLVLDSIYWGHTLVEFKRDNNLKLSVTRIPFGNVFPHAGYALLDATDNSPKKRIMYRDESSGWGYGSRLLEFGSTERREFGLLNKAVPYVLFAKFALSCWSELCEIYGIPPRYYKTDIRDTQAVNRARKMMSEMGSAAWFIIDRDEQFEFAKTTQTGGEVYQNLIATCNAQISMLISGGIISQDTQNGSRSKDESAISELNEIVEADKDMITRAFNEKVIPALQSLGELPSGDLSFAFEAAQDMDALWSRAMQAANLFDVDPQWLSDIFGIPISKAPAPALSAQKKQARFFE